MIFFLNGDVREKIKELDKKITATKKKTTQQKLL